MLDIDHSLPMKLLKAREATMEYFRPILAAAGLTEQQWRVLRILHETNSIESKELARRTFMLRPSISGVVDRLERDGLVVRKGTPDDGRKVLVALTEEGQAIIEQISPRIQQEYDAIRAQMSATHWKALYRYLDELIALQDENAVTR